MGTADEFTRVFADGPEVGIRCVVTADRAGAVPGPLAATVRSKLLFRLADAFEYGTFGVPAKSVPAMPPGRAIVAESGQVVHVARPTAGLVAGRRRGAHRGERAVAAARGDRDAARRRSPSTRSARAALGPRPWRIPVGLGERDLAPAALRGLRARARPRLRPGPLGTQHSARHRGRGSGRGRPAAVRVVVAGGRSPLPGWGVADHVVAPSALTTLAERRWRRVGAPTCSSSSTTPRRVDDEAGVLAGLVAAQRPGLHLVVAGRSDALRAAYSHWTRAVRRVEARAAAAARRRSRRRDPRRQHAAPASARGDGRPAAATSSTAATSRSSKSPDNTPKCCQAVPGADTASSSQPSAVRVTVASQPRACG